MAEVLFTKSSEWDLNWLRKEEQCRQLLVLKQNSIQTLQQLWASNLWSGTSEAPSMNQPFMQERRQLPFRISRTELEAGTLLPWSDGLCIHTTFPCPEPLAVRPLAWTIPEGSRSSPQPRNVEIGRWIPAPALEVAISILIFKCWASEIIFFLVPSVRFECKNANFFSGAFFRLGKSIKALLKQNW